MLKRALSTEKPVKIGHTGTLDPSASGVLIICLGRANRLAEYVLMHPKEYRGLIRLGSGTDTLDAAGKVIESKPVPEFDQTNLDSLAAEKFHGKIMQIPPAVSALKKDGERYYVKAQRGEPVEPPARETTIYSLALKKLDVSNIEILVRCSSGFYVRSLARDVARELGTVGHLDELVRTSVGNFTIDDAVDPGLIQGLDSIKGKIYPVDYPMDIIPRIDINIEFARGFIKGIPCTIESSPGMSGVDRISVYSGDIFLGIGEVRELEPQFELIPKKVITRQEMI